MKKLVFCLSIFTASFLSVAAQSSKGSSDGNNKYLRIAKSFLEAKQASYQLNATAADVDKVLDFCSDSIRYDHKLSPDKEFSFSGKDLWRRGAVSHLGETRNVKITIAKAIQRQNVVIMEFNINREVQTDGKWGPSPQTIVSVMEFGKDDKLQRITDYL